MIDENAEHRLDEGLLIVFVYRGSDLETHLSDDLFPE